MKDADRELVELAAKAYGLQVKGWIGNKLKYFDPVTGLGDWDQIWNPLENDGDAFRLLVKISQRDGGAALMLNSRLNSHHFAQCHTDRNTISPKEYMTENPEQATRRVITRTAAEIGRGDGMSKAKTVEEVRETFLDQIRFLAHYWARQKPNSSREACDGLAFSILNIFDGTSGLPAFDIIVRPHPDDKQYHIENGEDYYEDGMMINDCHLHEMYYRSKIDGDDNAIPDT